MNELSFAIAFALAATFAFAAMASAESSKNLLPNPGFEHGLSSWEAGGGVHFTVDNEVRIGGQSSARVAVPESGKSLFHTMYCSLPVRPGEVVRGRWHVRCSERPQLNGPYGVLEFWSADQKIGDVHSEIAGARLQPNTWMELGAYLTVPDGATSVRFVCAFQGQGSAWFDDVELTRIETAPGRDHTSVKLTLHPDEVISDHWQGFGAQGDLFLRLQRTIVQGVNDEDRALVHRRILAMRPKLVRLACNLCDWEAERGKHTPDSEGLVDLRETLAVYKQAGAEIQITEWGYHLPEWSRAEQQIPHPDERRAFTDSWASLLKYLRHDCGFTHIRYITLYNEPNRLSWEGYSDVYRALDASLKAAGIRGEIAIVGPDEACENLLMSRAVKELDDFIDYYDAHCYNANTGRESAYWIRPRIELMPAVKNGGIPSRKRFLITEFGMLDQMNTWFNPHNSEYDYGIFLADCAIVGCNEGVSGMAMWCLMDTDYGQRMKWGMWRFRDENWEPRPGFYSWSLITRYTELESTVNRLESNSVTVSSVALRAPDGAWTLMAVNRSPAARPLRVAGLPAGSKWEQFVYSEKTVPTSDREMIKSSGTIAADGDGRVDASLPPKSFVLWHEVR